MESEVGLSQLAEVAPATSFDVERSKGLGWLTVSDHDDDNDDDEEEGEDAFQWMMSHLLWTNIANHSTWKAIGWWRWAGLAFYISENVWNYFKESERPTASPSFTYLDS